MLKLTYCLHRLPTLTREQFQTYWRERHAPLVAEAAPVLGIKRYIQQHTAESAIVPATAEGRGMLHGAETDFDGIAELWFDSEAAVVAATATEEGLRHAHILADDEAKFIDFSRSRVLVSEENPVIG
jgi:uncharacterized protein (TIGR02118 family)